MNLGDIRDVAPALFDTCATNNGLLQSDEKYFGGGSQVHT